MARQSLGKLSWPYGTVGFLLSAAMLIILSGFQEIWTALGSWDSISLKNNALAFNAWTVSIQVLVLSSVFASIALVIAKLWLPRISDALRIRTFPVVPTLLAVLGIVPAGILVDETTSLLIKAAPNIFDPSKLIDVSSIFRGAPPKWFGALTLIITAAPAFSEELLFRGLVLRTFKSDTSSIASVFISAILFGLMHFDPVQGTGAFLLGIYMGFIAIKLGSIWPAIFAHAINNFMCSIFARFGPEESRAYFMAGHHPIIVLASFASMFFLIRFLFLSKTEKQKTSLQN